MTKTRVMWLVTFAYGSESAHAATVLAGSPEEAIERTNDLYKGGYIGPKDADATPVRDGLLVETYAPY